jgi:membrane associated rhomboid family serine protease
VDTLGTGEEVFRSAALNAVDERVLLLFALGIDAIVERAPGYYTLKVASGDAPRALVEIERYGAENRPRARPVPPKLHPGAIAAALAFVLVLFLAAVASTRSLFHLDWYGAGILDGTRVRAGELWRAVTALTLHADLAHLAANAGFGALFGGLAGRVYGGGVAWLLILVAAMLANLVNGLTMPLDRASLGASTAVFAALGALAVYRWPASTRRARLGRAGAPVVAALVLLAFLGTGDVHTDILAHALGFAAGLGLALPLRRWPMAQGPRQWLAGAAALLLVVGAWTAALVARHAAG